MNYSLTDDADFNVIIGEAARLDVGTAVTYIKSGQKEIEATVAEVVETFNANAADKTKAYDGNAEEKLAAYNANDTEKTEAYNANASALTETFNSNAAEKQAAVDAKAASAEASASKAASLSSEAENSADEAKKQADASAASSAAASASASAAKTSETNAASSAEKAAVSQTAAAGSETASANSAAAAANSASTAKKSEDAAAAAAELAKQWATKTDSTVDGKEHSSKYYAQQAESFVAETEKKIPSQASADNQLADKEFVNSSIATATADFAGTFDSLDALKAYTGKHDNNDYAFVTDKDASGNTTAYSRYKWDGSEWKYEYTLNNSSFTAAQWQAVNSGITSAKVSTYDGYAASKQDKLTFDTTPTANSTNPVTSGGIYAVIGDLEKILATI